MKISGVIQSVKKIEYKVTELFRTFNNKIKLKNRKQTYLIGHI